MTKKRVVLTVMAMIACGLLAACSRNEDGTSSTSMQQDTKMGVSQEDTTQNQVEDNKNDDKKASDGIQYQWPANPWVLAYPEDVKYVEYLLKPSMLFTNDSLNYLVTATYTNNACEGSIEDNLNQLITQSIMTYGGYCASTPDTTGEWVDGKLITKVKDVEGEYVEINGLNVYKFTAQIKIEGIDRYGYVYGYSWQYLTPNIMEESGVHKYYKWEKTLQYIVVGVVPVVDQETYKPDMEELTDYIMYHTEMLTE